MADELQNRNWKTDLSGSGLHKITIHPQGDQTRPGRPLDWSQENMRLWTQPWTPGLPLSFRASVSTSPAYGQSFCSLNRMNVVFPKHNMSSPTSVRAFRLLSWTLKKWEDKNVQEQGSLGHLRLRGSLEAVCVFTRVGTL